MDKEYEKIVEVPYDVVRENIIFKEQYVDIDERDLGRYKDAKVLPTDIEYRYRDHVTEQPVYVDKIVEREVFVPVDKIVEVPKERIVERPFEQVIERPVPVERVKKSSKNLLKFPSIRTSRLLLRNQSTLKTSLKNQFLLKESLKRKSKFPLNTLSKNQSSLTTLLENKLNMLLKSLLLLSKSLKSLLNKSRKEWSMLKKFFLNPMKK